MAAEKETLADFDKWWHLPKRPGWLQFPQAQKMAAKSAWDAAIKFMEEKLNSVGVAGGQGTANTARDEIAAAEKLCKIYFDIAASCIGEAAVRERVAAATSPVA